VLARALTTDVLGVGSIIHNAALESYLIHGRNVLDFFFADTRQPWPDDVIAEDFLEDPDRWRRERGAMVPVLGPLNRRVGKEIAHLTYERLNVTEEAKAWPFLDIALEVEALRDTFLSIVPGEHLSHEFWKGYGPFSTRGTEQKQGNDA